MAIPSEMAPELEAIIDAFNPNGMKRKDSIEKDICSWCGKPATKFRDALNRKEYTISGFCQSCQDEAFGR